MINKDLFFLHVVIFPSPTVCDRCEEQCLLQSVTGQGNRDKKEHTYKKKSSETNASKKSRKEEDDNYNAKGFDELRHL